MTGTSTSITGSSRIIRGEIEGRRVMSNTPGQPLDRPTGENGARPSGRGEHRDTVAMSEQGSALARIHEAVEATPDVRADRVAELKARIQAGTYDVDTDALAERMLDNQEP